jgi:hypothetical protein
VADPDVLVHHALARFLAHQVPLGRFRERVDDQVGLAVFQVDRLLLGGRALGVGRWAREAIQVVCDLQVLADASLEQPRCHVLHSDGRRALAPQQQIAAGFHAHGAVWVGGDAQIGILNRAGERLAAVLARRIRQPAPGRIGLEGSVLNE